MPSLFLFVLSQVQCDGGCMPVTPVHDAQDAMTVPAVADVTLSAKSPGLGCMSEQDPPPSPFVLPAERSPQCIQVMTAQQTMPSTPSPCSSEQFHQLATLLLNRRSMSTV